MVRGNFCLETSVWKLLKFKCLEIHMGRHCRIVDLNAASGCPFVGCGVIALVRAPTRYLQDFITFDYCYLADVYTLCKHMSF